MVELRTMGGDQTELETNHSPLPGVELGTCNATQSLVNERPLRHTPIPGNAHRKPPSISQPRSPQALPQALPASASTRQHTFTHIPLRPTTSSGRPLLHSPDTPSKPSRLPAKTLPCPFSTPLALQQYVSCSLLVKLSSVQFSSAKSEMGMRDYGGWH